MARKTIKVLCGIAVAGAFLAANYASQHAWPLWTVTIAGAVFVGAVVAYLLTTPSQ